MEWSNVFTFSFNEGSDNSGTKGAGLLQLD
jgi:hypothetical protein